MCCELETEVKLSPGDSHFATLCNMSQDKMKAYMDSNSKFEGNKILIWIRRKLLYLHRNFIKSYTSLQPLRMYLLRFATVREFFVKANWTSNVSSMCFQYSADRSNMNSCLNPHLKRSVPNSNTYRIDSYEFRASIQLSIQLIHTWIRPITIPLTITQLLVIHVCCFIPMNMFWSTIN